ncbi:MAG: tRNA (adenosine(37)-N6)-threonylcarbamoyltransferase complex ATPase subunit type 1 TsaE [Flavobacteriales bacterium]|nr:tRNA (adenosine(37)-N6)-threonylcarbamoyltransferase complex ATPase subunit type 1 TsaE [Flavobacteriales bacterium]
MTYTYKISGLPQAANAVLSNLNGKTLLFYGEMGVGKTTLIKEIAKQLGYKDIVSSPTYSLVNEYEGMDQKIYHFDFYRIKDETEALDMGLEDYLYTNNWNLIEWPEKIKNLLPKNADQLYILNNQDGTRTLKLNANE